MVTARPQKRRAAQKKSEAIASLFRFVLGFQGFYKFKRENAEVNINTYKIFKGT